MSTTPTTPEIFEFEVTRHITLPFYVMPEGLDVYIKFLTAFAPDTTTFSERVRKQRSDSQKTDEKKPMDIANIIVYRLNEKMQLVAQEEMRLVAHQVLKSTLDESYPESSYTGKSFRIRKNKSGRGNYFTFDIQEGNVKKQTPTPAPAAPAAPAPVPVAQQRNVPRK